MLWWLLACTSPPPSDATGVVPDLCSGHGDVQSIEEALDRVEDLPERSIACFVASLQRPVDVMAVASLFSAQPGSWWSPRFFLFTDDLVISVVPEGEGAHLLELGEWTTVGSRTLKGELVYPLEEGRPDPFTHLVVDEGSTCGACHTLEEPFGDTEGAFVSEAIEPTIGSRVPLDDVLEQSEICDPEIEPARCAILEAVMGRGDVNDAIWPN